MAGARGRGMRPAEPVVNPADRFGVFGLLLSLFAWAWAGCTTAPRLNPDEVVLVELIAERLEIGREVAWAKFNSGAAIVDPPREQVVLASFVGQATRAGIDPDRAKAFFNAQILASRQLQSELITGWRGGATRPATSPVDLVTVIRPRLDAIGEKMVAALSALPPPSRSGRTRIQAALQARGFSAPVARRASEGSDPPAP